MAVVLWKPLEVLASLEKTLPQLQVRLKNAVISKSGFLGFVDLADNGCPLQIYIYWFSGSTTATRYFAFKQLRCNNTCQKANMQKSEGLKGLSMPYIEGLQICSDVDFFDSMVCFCFFMKKQRSDVDFLDSMVCFCFS